MKGKNGAAGAQLVRLNALAYFQPSACLWQQDPGVWHLSVGWRYWSFMSTLSFVRRLRYTEVMKTYVLWKTSFNQLAMINEDMGFEDREGYQAVNSWNRWYLLWRAVINVTELLSKDKTACKIFFSEKKLCKVLFICFLGKIKYLRFCFSSV
jgi:hypothetical protein